MKVRVSFTVDIDVESWCLNYGIDTSEVRADVQRYVENGVLAELSDLGLLTERKSS